MKQIWLRLNPREQGLVMLTAALLLTIVIWQLTIAPAWQAVHEGPSKEATLLQQANQVLRAAQNLEQWRSQNARINLPKPTVPAAAMLEHLERERSRFKLEQQLNIVPQTQSGKPSPQTLRLEWTEAPALPLLNYLSSLENTPGLHIHSLNLESRSAGVFSGMLTVQVQP